MADFLEDYGGWIAFMLALIATAGSLFYSQVMGFIPCEFCWYQRILMYPLTVITLIGSIKRDDLLPLYVLPFSIAGLFVSGYHILLQNGIVTRVGVCQAGVSCGAKYVNYLGFISIPVMAFTAFLLITLVVAGIVWAGRQYVAPVVEVEAAG